MLHISIAFVDSNLHTIKFQWSFICWWGSQVRRFEIFHLIADPESGCLFLNHKSQEAK